MRPPAFAGGPSIPTVQGPGMENLDPFWTAVGAAIGAVGLWVANRLLGKAAFQTAINDGFAKLTQGLQEERDMYRDQLARERVEHARAEAELRGEIRNLRQTIESLKNFLRRSGFHVPDDTHALPTPLIELPGSAVTVRDDGPGEGGS